MMRKKNEVLSVLENLKTYTLTNGSEAGYTDLFAPVVASIEKYYAADSDLTKMTTYAIHQIALDSMNRSTKYEHQELLSLPSTDYPTGYSDITVIFGGDGALEAIVACGEEEFLQAFIYTVSITPETGGVRTAESNPYLDDWKASIDSARVQEKLQLQSITDFCEMGSFNNGLQLLFEDLGEVRQEKSSAEFAQEIYINRGYRELIVTLGLNIYIPTSVGASVND